MKVVVELNSFPDSQTNLKGFFSDWQANVRMTIMMMMIRMFQSVGKTVFGASVPGGGDALS